MVANLGRHGMGNHKSAYTAAAILQFGEVILRHQRQPQENNFGCHNLRDISPKRKLNTWHVKVK